MGFPLANKVAIVTGGARGIGFCAVKTFLQNGVRGVTIADVNENTAKLAISELEDEFGRGLVLFVKTDVSDKREFEEVFKKTIERFKNVDILVNNAGVIDDQCMEREVDINYKGTTHGTFLALETYISKHKSGEEGIIVNISSIAALDVQEYVPTYTATKFAILGLSVALGHESYYQRTGIKVICLCPGGTITSIGDGIKDKTLIVHEALIKNKMLNTRFQQATAVGNAIVQITREGSHGSVWVVEDNELYQIKLPKRDDLRYKL